MIILCRIIIDNENCDALLTHNALDMYRKLYIYRYIYQGMALYLLMIPSVLSGIEIDVSNSICIFLYILLLH